MGSTWTSKELGVKTAHIIAKKLSTLASMTSPSSQILNVAKTFMHPSLMSLAKHSEPFAFLSLLMSPAFPAFHVNWNTNPLMITSSTYQPSTNARTRTLHLLTSLLESLDSLHFLPSRTSCRRHPLFTSADIISANLWHKIQPMMNSGSPSCLHHQWRLPTTIVFSPLADITPPADVTSENSRCLIQRRSDHRPPSCLCQVQKLSATIISTLCWCHHESSRH